MAAIKGSKHATPQRLKRTFGAVINSIRTQRDLTQTELSKLCNIHKAQIGAIERGELPNPKLATIERLASGLRTTPWDLVRAMYD